jgi:hypothetical protein
MDEVRRSQAKDIVNPDMYPYPSHVSSNHETKIHILSKTRSTVQAKAMALYSLVPRRIVSKKIFDCLQQCTALEAVSIVGGRHRRCCHSTLRLYDKQHGRWNPTLTRTASATATQSFSTVGRRSTAIRKSSSSSRGPDDTTDEVETAALSPATTSSSTAAASSTLKLYRDCLRLVHHIAPGGTGSTSNKHVALKRSVTVQFKQRMHETDENAIERYKADAVRALSNYLLMASINRMAAIPKLRNQEGLVLLLPIRIPKLLQTVVHPNRRRRNRAN